MKKIMFNDKYDLTQAVLDGAKTMTRRVIVPRNENEKMFLDLLGDKDYMKYSGTFECYEKKTFFIHDDYNSYECKPKYVVGEKVAIAQSYESVYKQIPDDPDRKTLKKIYENTAGWHNKMFVSAGIMPHHIRITDVAPQKLQNISYDDCIKEGVRINPIGQVWIPNGKSVFNHPRELFSYLIDKLIGKGSWNKNPFVWVYSFDLVK